MKKLIKTASAVGKAQTALSRRGRDTYKYNFSIQVAQVAGLEAITGSTVAIQVPGCTPPTHLRVQAALHWFDSCSPPAIGHCQWLLSPLLHQTPAAHVLPFLGSRLAVRRRADADLLF
jgi:hypothetical protein